MIQKLNIGAVFEWGLISTIDFGKIYVAHPYGGSLTSKRDNQEMCERIEKYIAKGGHDGIIFSPIECFGWRGYGDKPYEEEMQPCFELLKACDCLFLTGDWRGSKGCCVEYAYALALGMDIYEVVFSEEANK